jgi:hypothetical protein
MATEVEILLKAIDHASAALNQVRGSSEKLGKGISGLEKNWNSMKSNVPGLSNVLALATNPITLVTAGVGALAAVMKAGISETVAYNKTIREMSQITGVIPEEISRIVQAADDWGISIDSVRTALQMANKNGYQPSIEMLANMADEYVNTGDKQAFAAEAIKVFGKQYATLIPMLSQGGDALRANTAAINDNLVVTQKEIDASREYEISVDLLSDTWTGAKQNIGNTVIPVLNDLVEVLTGSYDATVHAKDGVDELDTSILVLQGTLKGIGQLGGFVGNSLKGLARFMAGDYSGFMAAFDAAAASISEVSEEIVILDKGERDITATTTGLTTAYDVNNTSINTLKQAVGAYHGAIILANEAENAEKLAQEGLTLTTGLVNDAINGLNASMVETTAMTWAWQLATNAITQAQYDQNMAIIPQLANLESLGQLLDDGEISFSKYFQTVRDGKVTNEELISNLISTGMSASDAAAAVAALTANIYGIPDRDIYVRTHMSTIYDDNPRQENARGADYIVPSGYDENWDVGTASSGEHVEITPKNEVGNSTVNNNFNMIVHTNAGISTLVSDYNMLKAKVR